MIPAKKPRKKKSEKTDLREQITKTESLGSKIVKSKDILDINEPLFSTQKKKILEYALETGYPSKFILPIYESENSSHHPSDLSLAFQTMEDFVQENEKNLSVAQMVDKIRKITPYITEPEALYFISEFITDETNFKKEIQQISSTYSNIEVFQNEKTNYFEIEIPKLIKRDEKDLENLNQFFKVMREDLSPVKVSDMTIDKMTIEFDIILKNPEDNNDLISVAPDIFAQMKLSKDIPFVQYNDFQFKKYKVFDGETFESRPQFKLFENRFVKFDDNQMIYLILLCDPSPNISDYTQKSYIPAQINLEKNKLSFKYFVLYNRPEKEIVQAIQKLIPSIDLINRREKSYGAYFNVYDTVIRDDSFLDILLQEPFSEYVAQGNPKLFSSVLFIDEFEIPVSEKKKTKIYYDTNIGFEEQKSYEYAGREKKEELSKLASLGFYMTQYLSGENDSAISKGRYTITEFDENLPNSQKLIGLKDTEVKSLFLKLKTPYITVNISKAVNKFVLFQFMNIFARLLNLYNQTKDEFQITYDQLIPQLNDPQIVNEEDLSLIQKSKKKVGKEKYGKINLSTIAPEIFTSSYSRDCQFSGQPIIIPEYEVDNWENKMIKKDEKTSEKRPVLSLGDYYFVCPTDEKPYVQFKENLDSDRQYPHFPCCYKEKQNVVRERKKGSTYRTNVPIKTNKVMAEGGIATLPTAIEEMLKGAFQEQLTFYRMGSFISTSSVLACICLALDDKRFINQKTLDDKERYLNDLRIEIGNQGNFLTTSSELFDVSERDRIENFKKLEEFLDPAVYYRVLEEIFGINLFVFSGSQPKPNVDTVYSLEISRFSSIPIHSFKRNSPTILVYKHWGSETDHLDYPQCELIVTGVQGKDALVYNDDIARYLLKAYFIASEVYGKIYIPEQNLFEPYSSKFIYNVLQLDFLGSFMNPKSPVHAIGQILDEKGKLIALQLKTPEGRMTMGVPPLPPQDLPMITRIEKPNLNDVLKVFRDKPTGFTYSNGYVIAVWFNLLTMKYGIQIPIEPFPEDKAPELPSVPQNRFVLEPKQSEIKRLLKLQKDVNIIVQLIRWIYLVYLESEEEILSLDEKLEKGEQFLDEFLVLKNRKDEDSAKDYDFSSLPRKLPVQRDSFETILGEINKTSPTFTDGEKIFIYGKVFYSRIRESLIHYIRLNLPVFVPNYLDGFYESVYDYPVIPKTLVFLSEIDFQRWKTLAIQDPTTTYPVLYSLKPKLDELKYPYLYSIEKSKPNINNPFGESILFLIQNVLPDNGKSSALENALIWKEKQINHPKVSKKDISEFQNYKVFTISSIETLEIIEDQSDPQDLQNTLFILKYPNSDIYASILAI